MLIGRKNETLESINNSIQQNVSRWGVSNEMNEQIMTNIVGLQMKKIRLIKKKTQTRVANKLSVSFQQEQKHISLEAAKQLAGSAAREYMKQ